MASDAKLSNKPQQISEHVWYYENAATISLMVDRNAFADSPSCIEIKILSSKLVATLKRQGKI
jgi:hypothetical protein